MIDAEFLHNPHDKGMFCHCPSILETQSGTLMAVWYVYPEDEYVGPLLKKQKTRARGARVKPFWTPQNIPSATRYFFKTLAGAFTCFMWH
jgi:hypothetical protein